MNQLNSLHHFSLPCVPVGRRAGVGGEGLTLFTNHCPLITGFMNLEKTEIWITTDNALQLSDGRAIRGFFGNLYKNRPEFHGHRD